MKLAVIDGGTYCDFTLSYAVVKALLKEGHTIVLVTDKDNKVAKPLQGLEVVRYESVLKEVSGDDPDVINDVAATSGVPLENKLGAGIQFYNWVNNDMNSLMKYVWPKVEGLVFHYPALSYIASIPQAVLESKHLCVFYVAPGYPNIDAPWVFSLRLQDRHFALRTQDPHQQVVNYNSPKVIWKQSSMLTLWNNMLVENIMKRALIVSAWDPAYLPPTRPLPSDPLEFNVRHAGAIVDLERIAIDFESIPLGLPGHVLQAQKSFVGAAKDLVYVSLGSFDIGQKADELVVGLLNAVPDIKVFFHDTKKLQKPDGFLRSLESQHANRLLVWNGDGTPGSDGVPHEWIVPKCRFIVTTGSICLVNIALYHAVPMVIVPILTEQFFWGKNYQQQTGVPYVNVKDANESVVDQVRAATWALQQPHVAGFHAKVRESMLHNDGAKMLAEYVTKNITERSRRKFRPGECEAMKEAIERIRTKIESDARQKQIRDYRIANDIPEGTLRLQRMYEGGAFSTKEVPLVDNGHDIIGDANDKNLIKLVAPVKIASEMTSATQPKLMNTKNMMANSLFLNSSLISKFIVPRTRMATVERYFCPLILHAMLARHFDVGMRLYMDKCTYDFFHLITCDNVNFMAPLPDKGAYNLHDPNLDSKTDGLVDVMSDLIAKVQRLWNTFVGNWNMADALCHLLWFVASGYDENHVDNWHTSAQIFTVDVSQARPEWHEDLMVNLSMAGRVHWSHPEDEKYRFMIHDGYLGSVWRFFSMRQKRSIVQTIDGKNVSIAPPASVHLRDAHTNPMSFGDYQHSIVDFNNMAGKAYEWCVTPGVYLPGYVNFTPNWTAHGPICCYVNAKLLPGEQCIMNDQDYSQSVGLLWNRQMVDNIRLYRRYKYGETAVNKTKFFHYGIDEILLTLGMGQLEHLPSSVNDAWSRCFNDAGCRAKHAVMKYIHTLTDAEKTSNPLSWHANVAAKKIMAKSVVLPLTWIWAVNWSTLKGSATGTRDPAALDALAISSENMPFKYFFPLRQNRSTQWFPNTPCPGAFRRFFNRIGADVVNIFQPRMSGGGSPVQGLIAALMSDTPATWQEAGYEGLEDFVSKHPAIDDILSNADQVLQEYETFEASPSAVKPYDMLPREQILERMKSDYQEIIAGFAQACALEPAK
jgi:hypothetical protein